MESFRGDEVMFKKYLYDEINKRLVKEGSDIKNWPENKVLYTLEDYSIVELKNKDRKVYFKIFHVENLYYAVPSIISSDDDFKEADTIREAIVNGK